TQDLDEDSEFQPVRTPKTRYHGYAKLVIKKHHIFGGWLHLGSQCYRFSNSSSSLARARGRRGLGIASERVEDPDEIAPALKRALKLNGSGKPAFIEVICKQHPVYGGWMRA
ncbi:hypothetical protein MUO93_03245, partial [Candidatus Bathyarchaeota archaeon]|nr:hypothetical protein [Candidatus Bathyarchaeota archaeon]